MSQKIYIFLNIFVFFLFSALLLSTPLLAETPQKFSFTLYHHKYTVTPKQVEGSVFTFEDVKPHVMTVFLDSDAHTRTPLETLEYLERLLVDYEEIVLEAVEILAKTLVKHEPKVGGRDFAAIRDDLYPLFVENKWKVVSDQYKKIDFSVPYHALDVQHTYIRSMAARYIHDMIVNSPEGKKALAEQAELEAREKSVKASELPK